jgi:hypothetical protein
LEFRVAFLEFRWCAREIMNAGSKNKNLFVSKKGDYIICTGSSDVSQTLTTVLQPYMKSACTMQQLFRSQSKAAIFPLYLASSFYGRFALYYLITGT